MKKILIIGESCKDIFVYVDAIKLAPDVPVPVLSTIEHTENEGMARNVYKNIKSLSVQCDILTNENWEQITKTRYIHKESNHMFIRIDSDHSKIKQINLSKISFDYDIIAISDYNKGFLNTKDIEYICKNHPKVFIDTKKVIGDWAKDSFIIKINNIEYKNSLDFLNKNKIIHDKVIHTDGGNGAYYKNKHFPTKPLDVKDVSGAGDTFYAGLLSEYLKTNKLNKSINFANKCAKNAVSHKGVTNKINI